VWLKRVSVRGRIGPEKLHAIRAVGNDEPNRHDGHLDDGNHSPGSARHGIIPAGHYRAGILLANGAVENKRALMKLPSLEEYEPWAVVNNAIECN
jgi:hypothetical protein